MDETIKTVRLHAFTEEPKSGVPESNLTEEQIYALELVKRNALLEEEKKKSLEHVSTIEQLRASLNQEQAKAAETAKKQAELEAKLKELAALGAGESDNNLAQLEEEKKKSREQSTLIAQLKESLKQQQAETADILGQKAELLRNMAELEAKAKQLAEKLGRIAELADAGKAV